MRGILTEEEVEMSKMIGYLRGIHVLVSTPEQLAELSRLPEAKDLFTDLQAVAVDEVDACFKARILPKSLLFEAFWFYGMLSFRWLIIWRSNEVA